MNADSIRSPICAIIEITKPKMARVIMLLSLFIKPVLVVIKNHKIEKITVNITPPSAPEIVFLGLMDGNNLGPPIRRPKP